MKQHKYIFARLFVSLAVLLACGVVLVGLSLASLRLTSMQAAMQASSYIPSRDMESQARQLGADFEGTKRRVLSSLALPAFPESVSSFDPMASLAEINKLPLEQQPGGYEKLAAETSAATQSIKQFHVQEFRKAIESLRRTLLDYAAQVKATYQDPVPQQQTSLPPSPTPTPAPASTAPKPFRIFNDRPSADGTRLDDIESMRLILEKLKESSKKAESLAAIDRSSRYLDQAKALLDGADREDRPPQAPVQPQPDAVPVTEAKEDLVARAELIAKKLSQAEDALWESLYTDWVADDQAQQLDRLAESESARVQQLRATRKEALISGLRDASLTLLGAVAAAFIVMVAADLIRAFLNLSNNTDTLAYASLDASEQNGKSIEG